MGEVEGGERGKSGDWVPARGWGCLIATSNQFLRNESKSMASTNSHEHSMESLVSGAVGGGGGGGGEEGEREGEGRRGGGEGGGRGGG